MLRLHGGICFLLNYCLMVSLHTTALDTNNMASSSVEKIAAQNIRQLLVKSVSPVLKSLREPPDNPEDVRAAFGSLGPHLLSGVERARKQSGSSKQQSGGAASGATAGGSGSSGAVAPGRTSSVGGLPGGPPRPPSQLSSSSPSTPVHTQQVIPKNEKSN